MRKETRKESRVKRKTETETETACMRKVRCQRNRLYEKGKGRKIARNCKLSKETVCVSAYMCEIKRNRMRYLSVEGIVCLFGSV